MLSIIVSPSGQFKAEKLYFFFFFFDNLLYILEMYLVFICKKIPFGFLFELCDKRTLILLALEVSGS